LQWLRTRDRGLAALRRAGRTTIVMPGTFAISDKLIGNPGVATFAAFGSFSMLLLVDFGGPIRDRLRAQATLALTCGVLITIGTLASRSTPLGTLAMTLVAFAVLCAGTVSSTLAAATTSLLLSMILPVSLAGAASAIPDRLAGWGMASAASLLAISLLWPTPAREPLREKAIAALRSLADRLRSDVDYVLGGEHGQRTAAHDQLVARANAAVEELQQVFFATPYRPAGLSTAARMLVRLVDELRWLNAIIIHSMPPADGTPINPTVCGVRAAAAAVLEACADLLDEPGTQSDELNAAVAKLHEALEDIERLATELLPSAERRPLAIDERIDGFITALDPSFRAQELSFVATQIARNVDLAAAAARRSWLQRLLGRRPEDLPGPLAAAQALAGTQAERHSVWLHNSMRGAAALGLAVLVAKLTGVQHAFWVTFGTLSVLRSNVLSTGQNVLRGLLGTTAGFVIGAALVTLIGTDTTVLWLLLPVAVLLAGLAPAAFSFEAGQAAFTITLLVLFNILEPAGWRLGLVRIEDVALGGGVSLAVGLLFWPRGAAAALGDALADAYGESVRYLASAVEFGMSRCDSGLPSRPAPAEEARLAAAAARRLDDTFRGYLAERGAKAIPLAEMTGLVTGFAGLRLAGDAVLDLWQRDDGAGGERAAARRELLARSGRMVDWYEGFAASLTGDGAAPTPLSEDAAGDERLLDAVSHDLRSSDGLASATVARVIWTRDHLDAARRLQGTLVAAPVRPRQSVRPRGRSEREPVR
jgi:uncharacterized membrane protein YccC